jgi:hypothetical protein
MEKKERKKEGSIYLRRAAVLYAHWWKSNTIRSMTWQLNNHMNQLSLRNICARAPMHVGWLASISILASLSGFGKRAEGERSPKESLMDSISESDPVRLS